MKKRLVILCALVSMLALGLASFAVFGQAAHASPTTRYVAPSCASSPTPCYTTIQAAETAASAGDTIMVAAGTYTETVTITKSLTFLGAQHGVDARTRPTTPNPATESIVNGPHGGFYSTSGVSDITIDGFTVEDAGSLGTTDTGMLLLGGSGYQILNNIVQNNTQGSFFSSDGTTQTVFEHDVYRTNNLNGGSGGAGIFGGSGPVKNVLITENAFYGHTSSAITMVPASGTNDGLSITNNTSTGDATLVALFTMTGTVVSGNTVTGNTESAIYVGGSDTDTSIMGNTVSGGGQPGTAVRVTLFPCNCYSPNSNVTIMNNTLTGKDYGIKVGSGSGVATSSNVVAHFNSISGNAVDGLFVDTGAQSGPVDAICNYWGSASGPHSADNVAGTGDNVDGSATDKPFQASVGGPCNGPTVTNVATTPNPVAAGAHLTLTAKATGSHPIASAQYTIDGGSAKSMSASDGTFDQSTENLTAALAVFPSPGTHTVCVSATDNQGFLSAAVCVKVTVTTAGGLDGLGPMPQPPTILQPAAPQAPAAPKAPATAPQSGQDTFNMPAVPVAAHTVKPVASTSLPVLPALAFALLVLLVGGGVLILSLRKRQQSA